MIVLSQRTSPLVRWSDMLDTCADLRSRHAVIDRYTEMLDAIIDQRGSNGGWPPLSIERVSGWMVVRVAAKTFHKTPAQVAADLIKRWELIRR